MVKVELHTHTRMSYDVTTSYRDIIRACVKKNIDVLAVTDHNEIDGAYILQRLAPFRVIIGQEILTKDGEIIGLFLKDHIKIGMSLKETILEIKRQGGISYLPHPFDKTTRKTAANPDIFEKLVDEIDIVEVHNGRTIIPTDNRTAQEFATKYKKTFGVGSDSHTKYEYGRNYIEMEDFKSPSDFLKAIKLGKLNKSVVNPLVFIITKWERRRKKKKLTPKVKNWREHRCDTCGSSRYYLLYKKSGKSKKFYKISDDSYGVHHQIVKCVDCDLIYSYPRIGEGEMINRYTDFEDDLYEKERFARKKGQEKILNNLERILKKKGKILDVGCATGALVEVAETKGWKSYGVEPSVWASRIARKNKLKVRTGTIKDVKYPKSSFDAVTCVDVIEHVESPSELVENMGKLLKKGGVLCIQTPDWKSFIAKRMKEKWWHVRPDHIYYFDQDSLDTLMQSKGFSLIESNRPSWNFSYDYWESRLENTSSIAYKSAQIARRVPLLNKLTQRNYSINFYDSIESYYIKNE